MAGDSTRSRPDRLGAGGRSRGPVPRASLGLTSRPEYHRRPCSADPTVASMGPWRTVAAGPDSGPDSEVRRSRPVPDVLVSIVNHENRELVRACLLALPAACQGVGWQATVVDNVSCDGSRAMLAEEFPDVTVIANHSRLGFGANHNQVLRPVISAAGSDPGAAPRHVLILNDDTTLRPGAVARMVQMLDADARLGAVAPIIVDLEGRVAASRIAYPSAWSAWRGDWTDRTEPADPDAGFLQGCCLLIRVTALLEVGPFDERFFLFYEDTDLSRRLTATGWSLGVCDQAVVVHVGHASVWSPAMADLTPRLGRRSRYLYLSKYEGRPRAELVMLVGRMLLFVRSVKAKAGAIIRDDPEGDDRARRLFALARQSPRRPLFPGPVGPIAPTAIGVELKT